MPDQWQTCIVIQELVLDSESICRLQDFEMFKDIT
jgi:hypothetical protein